MTNLVSLTMSLEWVKVIKPSIEGANPLTKILSKGKSDQVSVVAFVNGKIPIILPNDAPGMTRTGGVFIWPKESGASTTPKASYKDLNTGEQAPRWYEGNELKGQSVTMLKVMPEAATFITGMEAFITLWEIDGGDATVLVEKMIEEAAKVIPSPPIPVPTGILTVIVNSIPRFLKWLVNFITGYKDDYMGGLVLRLPERAWDCDKALIDYSWEKEWEKEALDFHSVRFKQWVREHRGEWEVVVKVDRVCRLTGSSSGSGHSSGSGGGQSSGGDASSGSSSSVTSSAGSSNSSSGDNSSASSAGSSAEETETETEHPSGESELQPEAFTGTPIERATEMLESTAPRRD